MDTGQHGSNWQEQAMPGVVTRAFEGGYRLWLKVPPSAGDKALPVLWVLDGANLFSSVASAVTILSRRADATGVMPMVVVGIDHDPPDKARRDEDYSFGPCRDPAGLTRPLRTGGGAALLEQIAGPFTAAVQSRLPIDPERQALLGHSLAGYFALNAWAMQPVRWRVAGAISPSIWWDAPSVQTALSALPDLGQSLFLGAGEREEPAAVCEPADQRRIARGIVREARNAAEFARQRLDSERVGLMIAKGEDHASAFLTLLPSFLRFANAALSL